MDSFVEKFIDRSNKIIKISKKLKNLSPEEDLFQYMLNDLLIQTYTSYELFNKDLFKYLLNDLKNNKRMNAVYITSPIKPLDNRFWLPPTKKDDLVNHFPILKQWFFNSHIKNIDTLVSNRNSYAHSGNHQMTFEQILNSFLDVQLLVRFLYLSYRKENDVTFENTVDFINKEKSLLDHTNKMESLLKQLLKSDKKIIPPTLKPKPKQIFKEMRNLCELKVSDKRIFNLYRKRHKILISKDFNNIECNYNFFSKFNSEYFDFAFGSKTSNLSSENLIKIIQNLIENDLFLR